MVCVLGSFKTLTKKFPSAVVKPDNQFGSNVVVLHTSGLSDGIISPQARKASFNKGFKPLLLVAFRAIILLKPSLVKCCLFFIISYADLNNK
jgi:hypothetical protein